jgi:hypothetical protein
MQDEHAIYPGSGKKKALRPAGGGDLYYLAPKCL